MALFKQLSDGVNKNSEMLILEGILIKALYEVIDILVL